MSTLVLMTRSVHGLTQRESDGSNSVRARILRLTMHLDGGGDPRTPPADWRPTYPLDNPANEPDLWISDLHEPTIWCKLDKHPWIAPGGYDFDQERDEEVSGPVNRKCAWCGRAHQDVMSVYTFMLPEDY